MPSSIGWWEELAAESVNHKAFLSVLTSARNSSVALRDNYILCTDGWKMLTFLFFREATSRRPLEDKSHQAGGGGRAELFTTCPALIFSVLSMLLPSIVPLKTFFAVFWTPARKSAWGGCKSRAEKGFRFWSWHTEPGFWSIQLRIGSPDQQQQQGFSKVLAL